MVASRAHVGDCFDLFLAGRGVLLSVEGAKGEGGSGGWMNEIWGLGLGGAGLYDRRCLVDRIMGLRTEIETLLEFLL